MDSVVVCRNWNGQNFMPFGRTPCMHVACYKALLQYLQTWNCRYRLNVLMCLSLSSRNAWTLFDEDLGWLIYHSIVIDYLWACHCRCRGDTTSWMGSLWNSILLQHNLYQNSPKLRWDLLKTWVEMKLWITSLNRKNFLDETLLKIALASGDDERQNNWTGKGQHQGYHLAVSN